MHPVLVTMCTYTEFCRLDPARTVHLFDARTVIEACAPANDDISSAIAIQRGCEWHTGFCPAVHFATNGDVLAANQRSWRGSSVAPTLKPGNPSIPVIGSDLVKLSPKCANIVGIKRNSGRRGRIGDNHRVAWTDDVWESRNKLEGNRFCGCERLTVGILDARLYPNGVGGATFESALKGDAVSPRVELILVDLWGNLELRPGDRLRIDRICELKRPRHIGAAWLVCIPGALTSSELEGSVG